MALKGYVAQTDVTDITALAFFERDDSRIPVWLSVTESQIDSLALTLGISTSEIVTPLDAKIVEFGVSWLCTLIFLENIGGASVAPGADEVYRVKYDIYNSRSNQTRREITAEMFLGTATTQSSKVGGGVIWHG
jgi:hypothetical protein